MRGLILLLLAVACTGEPQSVSRTSNKEFKVEFLFEHDGCRVYRFSDGYYRYYVRCHESQHVEWQESCGKGCTRPVEINTEASP